MVHIIVTSLSSDCRSCTKEMEDNRIHILCEINADKENERKNAGQRAEGGLEGDCHFAFLFHFLCVCIVFLLWSRQQSHSSASEPLDQKA